MSKYHTVRAVQSEEQWWPTMVIDCPHDLSSRDRDCVVVDCTVYSHEVHNDTCLFIEGKCLAIDWLDAGGPDTLLIKTDRPVDIPFPVSVSFDGDGPVLTVPKPIGNAKGERILRYLGLCDE